MSGPPSGMGGPPSGGFRPPGGDSSDRSSRLEGFLKSMDANGNGVLEISEIPAERRGMFQFMASRAGLDASKPITISQIRDAMASRMSGSSSGGPPGSSPPSSGDKKETKKEEPPLVPGFGVGEEALVPGFGVTSTTLASVSSVFAGASASNSPAVEIDSRVRGFAEGMFRRYDRNQSGVLEKDEWGEIRGDPNAMDRNHDGRITMDEFLVGVAEFMKSRGGDRGRGQQSGESGASGRSGDDDDSQESARRSYRFLSPSERLPEEARDWITERDRDGDGQVAMAEFTQSWSDERAREFLRYDHNADGFVTADEYLLGPSSEDMSESGPSQGPPPATVPSAPSTPTSGGEASGGSAAWWLQ